MRYIYLYFYRWLKVTLLNFYRYLFFINSYETQREIQRYIPGDLVAINHNGDKYFVEVLDAVYYCSKPYYKLKSVMLKGFDSSRYVRLKLPNRRATPREMRKYESFLSKLRFVSGDWFYDVFMRTDIYQVLKVELDESSGNPYYTVSSFSGRKWSAFKLDLNRVKLQSQPKFEYTQKVYVESTNKQGVIMGVQSLRSNQLIYNVLVDGKRKLYPEDELLEFQKSCKMEKSKVETKVFEPLFKAEEKTKVESQESQSLFKVGDKVRIIPPKDPNHYRFGYSSEMKKLEGKIGIIANCYIYDGTKSYQDDNYVYKIDIDSYYLNWSSQSFEKVEDSKPQPLFKVGDRVKIIPPKNKSTYRGGYTTNMQSFEGRIVTITEVLDSSGSYNDDGYRYKIDCSSFYTWSSQSFVKADQVEPQPLFKVGDKVKVIPPKDPNRYRFGYNSEMSKLEGQIAVITSCILATRTRNPYNDDGYIYKIDIDSIKLNWSSQSFERVESAPLFKVGDSLRVDDTLLTTYPIQCGKLSIFDCLSDDRSAKEEEEKEKKKEKYKLNFKIK